MISYTVAEEGEAWSHAPLELLIFAVPLVFMVYILNSYFRNCVQEDEVEEEDNLETN